MDDGNRENIQKSFFRKLICKVFNVGDVPQPIWVRYYSISTLCFNRKFVERQFNFVLFIGSLLWCVFLLSEAI